MCGWSHMHLQACMSGQYYFQFSYWPEPSTLPGLRCWFTGLLSLPLHPLPPTCPWLRASPAGPLAWKISLWWVCGDWRRGRLRLWGGWKPQEEQHALTDRAWHWIGLQPRPGTFPLATTRPHRLACRAGSHTPVSIRPQHKEPLFMCEVPFKINVL